MRRVHQLSYSVRSVDDNLDFSNTPRGEWTVDGWKFEIDDLKLQATPERDYAAEGEARADCERLLADWEAHAEIALRRRIEFTFHGSLIQDLDAPDGIFGQVSATLTTPYMILSDTASAVVHAGRYPAPAFGFVESDEVRLLRAWLRDIRLRPGRYLAEVYWFLTYLRHRYGSGRGDAALAARLSVSRNVLTTLSRLQSVNDPRLGRKAEGKERELTHEELDWLQRVLERLVLRLGELAAGVEAEEITMDSFPSLPSPD